MPQWEADIEVGEELVRSLLAEQFPELDAASARLLDEGWDNSVWVVEERLAFRFPRREVAVPLVERELSVLPRLAPLVPIAVPLPTHVGRPGDEFPWPFFGCPLLPGAEPAEAYVPDGARAAFGRGLGRFLRVLHAPSTLAIADPNVSLPRDPNRRADMPVRVERTREAVGELGRLGLWHAPKKVERLLSEALELSPAEDGALVHGDLHLRHVLVAGGALSGVIDWGDVCVADPAIDLVLFWAFLPPAGREEFLAEYGRVGEERLLRSRVLALFLWAILAAYARDTGRTGLERECIAGLERTLVE